MLELQNIWLFVWLSSPSFTFKFQSHWWTKKQKLAAFTKYKINKWLFYISDQQNQRSSKKKTPKNKNSDTSVVAYLHSLSSSVYSGPLFGGRYGLICCQRCGGQMMWEARPWSSPTDTWEKFNKTQPELRNRWQVGNAWLPSIRLILLFVIPIQHFRGTFFKINAGKMSTSSMLNHG